MRKRGSKTNTIGVAVGSILTSMSWLPLLSFADCDQSAPMGDWKQGTESREEAEAYQTRELAETLEKFLDFLDETMPLDSAQPPKEDQSSASARSDATDVDSVDEGDDADDDSVASTDQKSNSTKGEETGFGDQSEAGQSRDSDGSLNAPNERINPGEVDSEGSYAKALREAHAAELDPKIKAALAVEYKKLTGRSI
jgi:hypothetical protein